MKTIENDSKCIEIKLDEADAAAARSDVRYSASEVFDRVRDRICKQKKKK